MEGPYRPGVIEWLRFKRWTISSFVQAVEELECSHTAGGNVKSYNQFTGLLDGFLESETPAI